MTSVSRRSGLPTADSTRAAAAAHPAAGVANGAVMVAWVVRIVLLAAGSLTGLFIAKDAPNFSVIQGMVATVLIVLFVFVLVFWPARWSRRINRDETS